MAISAVFRADFTNLVQEIAKVEVKFEQFQHKTEDVQATVARFADRFSGSKLISEAEMMAAAIEKIGGVSQLTEREAKRYGATMAEAMEKAHRTGQPVSETMRQVAAQTQQATTKGSLYSTVINGLGNAAKTAMLSLGAMFAVNQLIAYGSRVIQLGGELTDLASKTGLSTTALQQFKYAGGQVGVELDSITSGVNMLQKRLAGDDKNAKDAIEGLGLSFDAFKRLTPEAQFSEIAERVGAIENPIMRTKAAMHLFGNAGADLLPALTKEFSALTERANSLGIVMDEQTVAAMDQLGDVVSDLASTALAALGRVIAPLIPMFVAMAMQLSAMAEIASRVLGFAIQLLSDTFVKLENAALNAVRSILEGMRSFSDAVPGLDRLTGSSRGLTAAIEFLDNAQGKLNGTQPAVAATTRAVAVEMDTATVATKKQKSAVDDLVASLTGAGAIQQIKDLESAFKRLTPEQRANSSIVQEVLERYTKLRQTAGSDVSPTLEVLSAKVREEKDSFERLKDTLDLGMATFGQVAEKKRTLTLQAVGVSDAVTKQLNPAFREALQGTANLEFGATALAATFRGQVQASIGQLFTKLTGATLVTQQFTEAQGGLASQASALTSGVSLLTPAVEALGAKQINATFAGGALSHSLTTIASDLVPAQKKTVDLTRSLDGLIKVLEQAAVIGGDTFRGLSQWMGNVLAAGKVAVQGVQGFRTSLEGLGQGGQATAASLMNMTSSAIAVVGAMNTATASGNALQRTLGGVTTGFQAGNAILPGFGGAVGAVVGGVVGLARGLFGVSEQTKKLRGEIATFEEGLRKNLTTTQAADAAGRNWAATTIAVRDAYIATGRSAADAEEIVRLLWDEKNPQASRAAMQAINRVMEESKRIAGELNAKMEEARRVSAELNAALSGALQEAMDLGIALPEHLSAAIADLIAMGQITGDNAAAFEKLATSAPKFEKVEEAAKRYGVAIRTVGTDMDEAKRISAELNTKLSELFREASDLGVQLPGHLSAAVGELASMTTVTQDNIALMAQLTGQSKPNFEKMEDAAKKFGVALGALGPAFAQHTITEGAREIIDAFDLMVKGGADTAGVLAGMGDEISGLVQQSILSGQAVPENMRPIIEALLEQGRLTDENGEKLTDMSGIRFGEPVKTAFDEIIGKLQELVTVIKGGLGLDKVAYEQVQINERARDIIESFDVMQRGGLDVGRVIGGMSDEINSFVADTIESGRKVPENLRPILEAMIEQGRLTDANGIKLTDLGTIPFGLAVARSFDPVIEKLQELIDKISGGLGLEKATSDVQAFARRATGFINEIPTDLDITLHGRTSGDFAPGSDYQYDANQTFATGTLGRTGQWFNQFGLGTRAMLHGEEAVVRRDQAGAFAAAFGGGADAGTVDELRALRSDIVALPQHLARAVRDAILVAG